MVRSTKMYLIRRLYNLRMKESDSVQAHLNEYESLRSQISSQGMTIEDELRAMILMSSLPSSWETFVTTVCNASTIAIKYSKVMSAILTEAARRKSFTKDSAEEAYVVQSSIDRSNNRGRSSSRPPRNQRSRSKSRETRICNNLELIQLDVKTAFLHGDLKEEITWSSQKALWPPVRNI